MHNQLSLIVKSAVNKMFVKGETDSIGEFFSQDYVVHLTNQDYSAGHKVVRMGIEQVRKAFPELTVTVEIFMESSDKVAWQRTLCGVQAGAYKGFPACNREITWREMGVSRLEGGLITEEWVSTDLAEQLLAARKK